jgi:CBS domain-containing protein
MSEGPVSVGPDTPMVAAARLLLEQRIGALPVRDGEQIVGIFTAADALDALLAMVERPRR